MLSELSIYGVKKNSSAHELSEAIKTVFLKSTNNLSWLKPGDKVLLKPALNSPDPYPSTTHPLAIKVIAEILTSRGAKVYVGDQSGIEHVVHGKHGVVRGSSESCFVKSGMAHDKKYNFISFEKGDWDKDFIHIENSQAFSWPDGFYVTRWIEKVDHIINLPRLSTHLQAGVTLGFKNFVGILREDSRYAFHMNGPFSPLVPRFFHETGLKIKDDKTKKFFEKITEISLAVQNKLRLTLFVGTEAQITAGPDRSTSSIKAKIAVPDTGFVFASSDQVAAEAFAIANLTDIYIHHVGGAKYIQKFLMLVNAQAKELSLKNIWDNPFLVHALKLKLGHRDFEMIFYHVTSAKQQEMQEILR